MSNSPSGKPGSHRVRIVTAASLFDGHDAAINIGYYYTIFGTCKALGVNPYDYIVWYLSKVPSLKTLDIAQLAPDAFKKSLDVNT